jgi:uncharacterized protein
MKTQKKRKPIRKKTAAKQSGKLDKLLKSFAYLLIFIFIGLSVLVVGYYFGYKDASKTPPPKKTVTHKEAKKTPTIDDRLREVLKQQSKSLEEAKKEEQKALQKQPLLLPKVPKQTAAPQQSIVQKPKLALIFDDVSFPEEVRAINNLHLRVTMSFFPPNYIHPDTAKLAAKQPFYMVHLPLEAIEFHHPEPHTLMVNSSMQTIEKRIKTIKEEFPRLRYINNHTGSTFTASKPAMEKLIYVLKQYHIQFIDSRTTAQTKAPEVTKEFHMPYIARDVFLDDKLKVPYIIGQLKEAIRIAKKKGHAIAIGHPHPQTIQAIEESKNLLKQVQLVYVNEL